jgi:type I restriction enzyme S subunit
VNDRTLGDYLELQRGNTYKSALLGQPGPVLLGLATLARTGGFRRDSMKTYGGESDERILLRPGELYVSLKDVTQSADLLGAVARVPADVKLGRLTQDTVRLKLKKTGLEGRYVYWVLRGPECREYCRARAIGTTNLSLSRGDFLAYPIRPPTPEDLAGVELLDAFDDKIELNRRLNETLEASARALFKSWFVDFDPVADNATGRDALTEHWVAELYPADLKESPLGAIPTTWTTGRISDLCTTQYGYTASAEDRPVGPKFLRVMDVNKHPWIEWGTVPHCRVGNDDREKYGLRVGDIVVARMADPGKAAVVEEPVDAVFASYLVRLKTSTLSDAYFLYGFLKSKHYADYALAARGGSVQANMNARVIVDCPLPLPPQPVRAAYLEVVLPLRQRLCASVRESALLAIVRDALLPKLLSGELRPKDAGRQVEAVV